MSQLQKYSVSYASGATGYGWDKECSTVKEVESLIEEYKDVYSASFSVFDRQLGKFVFNKRSLSLIPDIDLINSNKRDLRTTSRKTKGVLV